MPDEKGSAATTTPATPKPKQKLYYPVDAVSPDGANKTISTLSVHPKLFDAAVKMVASKKGTTDGNGHGTVLPDGAFALWLREIIADASGYPYATPSDLALPLKGKGKAGTGKGAQAVKAKTLGVVRQVFASIRGAMPADAALELARKIATENSSQLTDAEITALWEEAS